MNKKELIQLIATENNVSKKWATTMVDNIFNHIIKALNEHQKVNINNFGVFTAIQKPEYEWFNPITKEKQTVLAKTKIKFKIASSWQNQLKKS